MSKRRHIQSGFTRQGVKNLNHLKGKSMGRRLELPSEQGGSCAHLPYMLRDRDGIVECSCGLKFDFDGKPI